MTSCNQYLKTGIAGSTDVVLTKSSDEYTIKKLKPIELEGTSLFGIPGFGTNNKNKNKTGMIFKLNGVTIGSTPRILPILTLLGASFASGRLIQEVVGTVTDFSSDNYGQYRLSTPIATLVGLPMGGIFNNLLWSGSATSGLTNQLYYHLVDENPDVDIFTNPKYKIDYKLGLFSQKASVRAEIMGATLKIK
jgi:hypothetical protein